MWGQLVTTTDTRKHTLASDHFTSTPPLPNQPTPNRKHSNGTTKRHRQLLPTKTNTCYPHRLRLNHPSIAAQLTMYRDVSACNTYNYGDALYWDARYIQEGGSFDWYQRYSALRPFARKYIPTSSRILMVGCGNAVMSEDMVKDGYEDIMNIDISSVAIDMMRRKYEHIPQLKYLQMDVKDMSFFPDESFDAVVDKVLQLVLLKCWGKLAGNLLYECQRYLLIAICCIELLKPGGIYMLITYGDPTVRIPHLSRPVYNWKTELYIIPRPGFQRPAGSTSAKSYLEPVPTTEKGLLPAGFIMEDPDSHFVYVCRKMDETTDLIHVPSYPLTADVL
ncbi:hypothetical protein RHGRI_019613 [Rhododendron griersonianum]|uniref:Methyltransferase domain-containing protein n=1 Tax=Rhododendron griersonianum TaxID=479676 RepID=A0AAV6JKP2_9ERIC|nr:hypothetical protein RHGRI_019613 [Rhododendron griersonianum]